MSRKSVILALVVVLNFALFGAEKTKITGIVLDQDGEPLPSVNVFISETSEGTTSNNSGEFSFTTTANKPITLTASMIGYSTFKNKFDITELKNELNLKIVLEVESIELEEAVVMGSSFSSESGKGLVVSSMDVMTTPGGAADLFQSLKTMPGLTQVSESAELYVRGGNPIETVTLIDQASIYHPYTYESSYGGLFSNLNTGAVSEMYFSSGGFSAKYGNVLSGVLDIQTKDEPVNTGFALGLSMAAASLDGEVPIVNDKIGLRFYGQQSYTKPIMWLNDGLDEFTATPSSRNLTASLIYNFSKTGQIKLMSILAGDSQGVNVNRAEYNGVFSGESETEFYNLQLKEILGQNTIIKSSLSVSAYKNNWQLGVLDLDKTDRTIKSRTDVEHTFTKELQLLTGFELENRVQKFVGTIPSEDYDIRPEAANETLNESIEDNRIGIYAELNRLNLFGIQNFFGILGLRSDHFTKLNITNFDQRLGFGYQISESSKLRFAFGTFHQVPDYRLYASEDGNPNLKSMRAIHYVLSYDYEINKKNSLRVEVFHKDYSHLPLEDEISNYNNKGYGFASGVDFIFKGDLPLNLTGWISYGFVDTKRKWMDYENLARSDYDITHNLSLVLKYNFSAMWQLGINFKYATGRPYTPVIGSNFISDINLYEPIYGEKNSERYPDYKRLDLRLTHLNQLFGKVFTVFYIEALNILNINNLFGYSYNDDYSEQNKIRSYFGRRTIVVGALFTF